MKPAEAFICLISALHPAYHLNCHADNVGRIPSVHPVADLRVRRIIVGTLETDQLSVSMAQAYLQIKVSRQHRPAMSLLDDSKPLSGAQSTERHRRYPEHPAPRSGNRL
jgi:hypothetical protein